MQVGLFAQTVELGRGRDEVVVPQDKLGKGLPEAASAVVGSAEAGSVQGAWLELRCWVTLSKCCL